MPLVLTKLADALEPLLANPPVVIAADVFDAVATRQAVAQKWADAMQAYASGIVPPSTAVPAAASAMVATLAAAFAIPGGAAPGMEAAFKAFAGAVGLGMAGFVPTPPPAPVNFALLLTAPPAPTPRAGALYLAGLIDAWMKTGIATLVAPPNTPQPWA